jgi:hypothetical protein
MPKQEVTMRGVEEFERFFDNLKESAINWLKSGDQITVRQEGHYRPVYNDKGSVVDQIFTGSTFEIYIGLPNKQPQ